METNASNLPPRILSPHEVELVQFEREKLNKQRFETNVAKLIKHYVYRIDNAIREGYTSISWYDYNLRQTDKPEYHALKATKLQLEEAGWYVCVKHYGDRFGMTSIYWSAKPFTWFQRLFL
jgi:hypothetical protein